MTQLVWSLPSLSSAVVLCVCVCSQPQLCSQPGHHLHRDLPGGSARSRSINYSCRMNLLRAITFPGSSLTPSQLHEQAWICSLTRNGLQVVWMTGVWSGYFYCLWKFIYPAVCPWDAPRKKEHNRASCWIPGRAQDSWTKELFPGRHLCLSGYRLHWTLVFYHIGELAFKQISTFVFKEQISDSELGTWFRPSLINDRQFKERLENL